MEQKDKFPNVYPLGDSRLVDLTETQEKLKSFVDPEKGLVLVPTGDDSLQRAVRLKEKLVAMNLEATDYGNVYGWDQVIENYCLLKSLEPNGCLHRALLKDLKPWEKAFGENGQRTLQQRLKQCLTKMREIKSKNKRELAAEMKKECPELTEPDAPEAFYQKAISRLVKDSWSLTGMIPSFLRAIFGPADSNFVASNLALLKLHGINPKTKKVVAHNLYTYFRHTKKQREQISDDFDMGKDGLKQFEEGAGDRLKNFLLPDLEEPKSRIASDGTDLWGKAAIVEPPLHINRRKPEMSQCQSIMGVHLTRPDRLLIDCKVFKRRRLSNRHGLIGTVLIDCSGSMAWPGKILKEALLYSPYGKAAIYSGGGDGMMGSYGYSGVQGMLVVVGAKGRIIDWGDIDFRHCLEMNGNVIDGPALDWLAKQPPPRWWVSDGGVTGINDYMSYTLHLDAAQKCARAGITRVSSFSKIPIFDKKHDKYRPDKPVDWSAVAK